MELARLFNPIVDFLGDTRGLLLACDAGLSVLEGLGLGGSERRGPGVVLDVEGASVGDHESLLGSGRRAH